MKRSIILGLGTVLFLIMIMGFVHHQSNPTNFTVKLIVTSSIPQSEIKFNAAYVVGEKPEKSQFGTFQTPYEISVSANSGYVAGLFSKIEGNGFLDVGVEVGQNGHTLNSMSGSGSTVVVSTIDDGTHKIIAYP